MDMMDFKKTLLSIIDDGAAQATSMIERVNDMFNSFDVDAQIGYLKEKKKEIINRGNQLIDDFNGFLKQIRESLTDFSVTVPFDEASGENITYKVEDGKLEIEVSYSDKLQTRSNKTSVAIPNNCDLEQISFTSNSTLKTATVTIPKVVEPNMENDTTTKNQKKTVRKKASSKKIEEDDKMMTHISNKLTQKLNVNGEKYVKMFRDNKGRFVRRTPKK